MLNKIYCPLHFNEQPNGFLMWPPGPHYCVSLDLRQHAHKSHVWHNSRLVPSDTGQPLRIEDGDYIHVFIGDEDQRRYGLGESDSTALLQRLHKLKVITTRVADHQERPHHLDFCVSQGRPRRRRPLPPDDPDEDDQRRLFQQLWDRATLRSRGLQNEPVMIFDTWFPSGLNFPQCSHSRSVVLPADISVWEQRLLQVWRDRYNPHWPVRIVRVHPDPPGHTTRKHGGQLLVLQHERPDEAGVLLGQYYGLADIEPFDRFAQLVPAPVSFLRLLWVSDLEILCERSDTDCVACHERARIAPDVDWQTVTGQHLEFYVQRRKTSN